MACVNTYELTDSPTSNNAPVSSHCSWHNQRTRGDTYSGLRFSRISTWRTDTYQICCTTERLSWCLASHRINAPQGCRKHVDKQLYSFVLHYGFQLCTEITIHLNSKEGNYDSRKKTIKSKTLEIFISFFLNDQISIKWIGLDLIAALAVLNSMYFSCRFCVLAFNIPFDGSHLSSTVGPHQEHTQNNTDDVLNSNLALVQFELKRSTSREKQSASFSWSALLLFCIIY